MNEIFPTTQADHIACGIATALDEFDDMLAKIDSRVKVWAWDSYGERWCDGSCKPR